MKRQILIVTALGLLAQMVQGADTDSYKMTQVTKSPEGREQVTTTWYVSPEKSRIEQVPVERSPMPAMVMIVRQDKGVVWTLFPTKNAYMEGPLDEDWLGQMQQLMQKNRKAESLGSEEILGYDCDKQKVTNRIDMGPRSVEIEQTIWQCEGFDYPLRILSDDGSVTEATELETGRQPDDLFEVPGGFKKVANMMELMQDMMR